LNFSLLGTKKEFRKRSSLPGQHGNKKHRFSLYYLQNREKQKFLHLFMMRQKPLHNLFLKLKNKKGNIEDNLLANLNSSLANIVFLSGLVNTRRFARQLVSHGHFLVDGKKVKSPSFRVKVGSIISPRDVKRLQENKIISEILKKTKPTSPYINFDKEKLAITYQKPFAGKEENIDISSIVE